MTYSIKSLFLIGFTFLFFSANGQGLDTLKMKMERIIKEYNIPGASMIIVNSDEVLFAESVGVKNLETKEPMNPSDNIHLGSCSKAITGYLAGVYVEKGLISWNSTLLDIYPELKDSVREDYHNATLNDFLSHHAGVIPFPELQDFFDYEDEYVTEKQNLPEIRYNFVKWALAQAPVQPDSIVGKEDFVYSNAGYVVASSMLEKVSGKSWEKLINDSFFKDLDIDGIVGWPASKDIDQPWGHWWNTDSTALVPVDPKGKWQISNYMDPAGDISMPSLDYGKWLQKNLKGLQGEDESLPKELFEYLHYANFNHSYYSMGWGSFEDSEMNYTLSNHSGSADTFYCHVLVVRELDLAIAVMSNVATTEGKSGVKELVWGYYKTVCNAK